MRIAAFVAGLIGGVGGLLLEVKVVVSGWGELPANPSVRATLFLMLGISAVIILLGIVGAFLARSKPVLAGVFMLLSGVVGFLLQMPGYVYAGPVLLVAAILAFIGARSPGRKARQAKASG